MISKKAQLPGGCRIVSGTLGKLIQVGFEFEGGLDCIARVFLKKEMEKERIVIIVLKTIYFPPGMLFLKVSVSNYLGSW